MSFKDYFQEKNSKSRSLTSLSDSTEGRRFVTQKVDNLARYVPTVDFSDPSNFANFGLAEKYYRDSFKRVYSTYPYDGTFFEKEEWQASSSYIDLFLFENKYPRTNGYVNFSPTGWGSLVGSQYLGAYGKSSSPEYIFFFGSTVKNVYNPSAKQESNLKISGIDGNTVEFWLKKSALVSNSLTKREVIFDAHTVGDGSGPSSFGRFRIDLATPSGGGSLFHITYQSSSAGTTVGPFFNQIGDTTLTTATVCDGKWHHYAFTIKHDSTNNKLIADMYVDGKHNQTKDFTGIASFGHIPTTTNGCIGGLAIPTHRGYGKLSGSLDDFRFWKEKRTAEQIGRNYFREVAGGTNKYIDNAALGVYYKFNEGITGTSSVDQTILDYSGRLTNTTFTGYNSYTRNTQSAIVLSGKAEKEFKDPILYPDHPDYISSLKVLTDKGEEHDLKNTSAIWNSIPMWMKREDGSNKDLLLELTQILASYFDTAFLQIKSLPILKNVNYSDYLKSSQHANGSKPPPFIHKALESAGFLTPELFADASVLERLHGQDNERKYDEELEDVKNFIYRNIYNNLTHIYKTKGTEKSFRNLFRCFGIDEEVVKLNIYGKNSEFVIEDSPRYTAKREAFIDFDNINNFSATFYQSSGSMDPDDSRARSCIAAGFETMPFTMEADVMFPEKFAADSVNFVDGGFTESSIFGFHEPTHAGSNTYASPSANSKRILVNDSRIQSGNISPHVGNTIVVGDGSSTRTLTLSYESSPDTNINASISGNTSQLAQNIAGAINGNSGGAINITANASGNDVILTHDSGGEISVSFNQGSHPEGGEPNADPSLLFTQSSEGGPISDMDVYVEKVNSAGTDAKFVLKSHSGLFSNITSDTIVDLYDNKKWTLAVSVKPIDYPLTDAVTGSRDPGTYTIEFYGVHYVQDELIDSFKATGTCTAAAGKILLENKKKIYAGAKRTNYTGSVTRHTDVLVSSVRYWQSLLTNEEVNNHAIYSSYGQNKVYEQPYVFENSGSFLDIPKYKTLSLHWDFNNLENNGVTDANGGIVIQDYSSGSDSLTDPAYGYLGNIINRSHPGLGFGFPAMTDIIDYRYINVADKNDIEQVYSSNMIKVEDFDLENFRRDYKPQELLFAVEKSFYDVISSEMLKFFGTITDFNNLIGEPVNKYRQEYKSMEKLRDLFFSRVKNTPSVEKYLEYYKWFDSAVSTIIANLKPATANMVDDLRTLIESHLLERNKYWHKFPTLEMKAQDPFPSIRGVNELLYDWEHGHAPFFAGNATATIKFLDTDLTPGRTISIQSTDGKREVYKAVANNPQAIQREFDCDGVTVNNMAEALKVLILSEHGHNGRILVTRDGATLTLTQAAPGGDGDSLIIGSLVTLEDKMEISSQFTGGIITNQAEHCLWWKDRAERKSTILTTGDADINSQKETINRIRVTDVSGSTYATRRLSRPYRFGVERSRDLSTGNNPTANKLPDLYKAAVEFGTDNGIAIAKTDIQATASCNDKIVPNKKHRIFAKADTENTTGYLDADADLIFPFTIMSSSIDQPLLSTFVTKARITNQHIDSYGPTTEVPLQGPFAQEHVGGQPHRHGNLLETDPTNRIEGYKLKITSNRFELQHTSPESPNNVLVTREGMTKSPVNIKNIQTVTGSVIQGNFNNPYDYFNTAGRTINNQGFVEDTSDESVSTAFATSLERAKPEREVVKNVFAVRFDGDGTVTGDHRGGPNLDRDFGELSANNSMNMRNLLQRETLNLLSSEKSQRFGIRSGSAVEDVYSNKPPASFHKINRNPKFTKLSADVYTVGNPFIKLAYSNNPGNGNTLTLTSTAGVTKTYEFRSSGDAAAGNIQINIGVNGTATYNNLLNAIAGASGHNEGSANSVFILSLVAGHTSNHGIVTITQKVAGTAANTVVTSTLESVAINNGIQGRTNTKGQLVFTNGAVLRQNFDNLFVQRPIPQNDLQYTWITASSLDTTQTFPGYQHNFTVPHDATTSRYQTELRFISSSDVGSHINGGNRYFGSSNPLSFANSTDPSGLAVYRSFVPTSFVGISTNIFEPVSSSSNILGYPEFVTTHRGALSSYVEANYINQSFVGGLPIDNFDETVVTANTNYTGPHGVLNALIHHRGGSYGYPSWKQMRGGEHPIARVLRKENIYTVQVRNRKLSSGGRVPSSRTFNTYMPGNQAVYLGEPENREPIVHTFDREVKNYYEIPVSVRFKPINFAYFGAESGLTVDGLLDEVDSEEFETRWLFPNLDRRNILLAGQLSYGNRISRFANRNLTNLLKDNELTNDTEILDLFVDNLEPAGSVPRPDSFYYTENIYPRENETFRERARSRTAYMYPFWKENRSDRQTIYKLDLLLDVNFNADSGGITYPTTGGQALSASFAAGIGIEFTSVRSDIAAVSGLPGMGIQARKLPVADSSDKVLALSGAASTRARVIAVEGAGCPPALNNRDKFRTAVLNKDFATPCSISYSFRGAASNDDGYVFDNNGGTFAVPEAEKDLFVQYKVTGGEWITLKQHINTRNSDGTRPFTNVWHLAEHELTEDIGNVRFRFISRTDKGNLNSSYYKQDIWLIDNIKVESNIVSNRRFLEENSMGTARLERTIKNTVTMITSSIWPLDARQDFTNLPTNLTHSFRQFSGSQTVSRGGQGQFGEGELQNDYNTWHLGLNQEHFGSPASALYARRWPQKEEIYSMNFNKSQLLMNPPLDLQFADIPHTDYHWPLVKDKGNFGVFDKIINDDGPVENKSLASATGSFGYLGFFKIAPASDDATLVSFGMPQMPLNGAAIGIDAIYQASGSGNPITGSNRQHIAFSGKNQFIRPPTGQHFYEFVMSQTGSMLTSSVVSTNIPPQPTYLAHKNTHASQGSFAKTRLYNSVDVHYKKNSSGNGFVTASFMGYKDVVSTVNIADDQFHMIGVGHDPRAKKLYLSVDNNVVSETYTEGNATTYINYIGNPADGQFITLRIPDGTSVTYEFDSNGSTTAGRKSVTIVGTAASEENDATLATLANSNPLNAETQVNDTWANFAAAVNKPRNEGGQAGHITAIHLPYDKAVALTQVTGGVAGNTAVTFNASNINVRDFSGGGQGAVHSFTSYVPYRYDVDLEEAENHSSYWISHGLVASITGSIPNGVRRKEGAVVKSHSNSGSPAVSTSGKKVLSLFGETSHDNYATGNRSSATINYGTEARSSGDSITVTTIDINGVQRTIKYKSGASAGLDTSTNPHTFGFTHSNTADEFFTNLKAAMEHSEANNNGHTNNLLMIDKTSTTFTISNRFPTSAADTLPIVYDFSSTSLSLPATLGATTSGKSPRVAFNEQHGTNAYGFQNDISYPFTTVELVRWAEPAFDKILSPEIGKNPNAIGESLGVSVEQDQRKMAAKSRRAVFYGSKFNISFDLIKGGNSNAFGLKVPEAREDFVLLVGTSSLGGAAVGEATKASEVSQKNLVDGLYSKVYNHFTGSENLGWRLVKEFKAGGIANNSYAHYSIDYTHLSSSVPINRNCVFRLQSRASGNREDHWAIKNFRVSVLETADSNNAHGTKFEKYKQLQKIARPEYSLPSGETVSDFATGGTGIAITGEYIFVGASDADDKRGKVFVYKNISGSDWVLHQTLEASERATDDYFGYSVDAEGKIAVVGADGSNASKGFVYVFELNDTGNWIQTAKLEASDPTTGHMFGRSVAISGTTVSIGAPLHGTGGAPDNVVFRAGVVYIFDKNSNDGTWSQTTKLVASDGLAQAGFGQSTDILDDYLFVGALDDDTNGDRSGKTYVFKKDLTGTWREVAILTASEAQPSERFGSRVSISGNTALIASVYDDNTGEAGAAYFFQRDENDNWLETSIIAPFDGLEGDRFSSAVSLSGDTALIGAYGNDDKGNGSGAAYVYQRGSDFGEWNLLQKLDFPDSQKLFRIGISVKIGPDGTLYIGSSTGFYIFKKSTAITLYDQEIGTENTFYDSNTSDAGPYQLTALGPNVVIGGAQGPFFEDFATYQHNTTGDVEEPFGNVMTSNGSDSGRHTSRNAQGKWILNYNSYADSSQPNERPYGGPVFYAKVLTASADHYSFVGKRTSTELAKNIGSTTNFHPAAEVGNAYDLNDKVIAFISGGVSNGVPDLPVSVSDSSNNIEGYRFAILNKSFPTPLGISYKIQSVGATGHENRINNYLRIDNSHFYSFSGSAIGSPPGNPTPTAGLWKVNGYLDGSTVKYDKPFLVPRVFQTSSVSGYHAFEKAVALCGVSVPLSSIGGNFKTFYNTDETSADSAATYRYLEFPGEYRTPLQATMKIARGGNAVSGSAHYSSSFADMEHDADTANAHKLYFQYYHPDDNIWKTIAFLNSRDSKMNKFFTFRPRINASNDSKGPGQNGVHHIADGKYVKLRLVSRYFNDFASTFGLKDQKASHTNFVATGSIIVHGAASSAAGKTRLHGKQFSLTDADGVTKFFKFDKDASRASSTINTATSLSPAIIGISADNSNRAIAESIGRTIDYVSGLGISVATPLATPRGGNFTNSTRYIILTQDTANSTTKNGETDINVKVIEHIRSTGFKIPHNRSVWLVSNIMVHPSQSVASGNDLFRALPNMNKPNRASTGMYLQYSPAKSGPWTTLQEIPSNDFGTQTTTKDNGDSGGYSGNKYLGFGSKDSAIIQEHCNQWQIKRAQITASLGNVYFRWLCPTNTPAGNFSFHVRDAWLLKDVFVTNPNNYVFSKSSTALTSDASHAHGIASSSFVSFDETKNRNKAKFKFTDSTDLSNGFLSIPNNVATYYRDSYEGQIGENLFFNTSSFFEDTTALDKIKEVFDKSTSPWQLLDFYSSKLTSSYIPGEAAGIGKAFLIDTGRVSFAEPKIFTPYASVRGNNIVGYDEVGLTDTEEFDATNYVNAHRVFNNYLGADLSTITVNSIPTSDEHVTTTKQQIAEISANHFGLGDSCRNPQLHTASADNKVPLGVSSSFVEFGLPFNQLNENFDKTGLHLFQVKTSRFYGDTEDRKYSNPTGIETLARYVHTTGSLYSRRKVNEWLSGESKWLAPSSSGLQPFYKDYNEYREELRAVGKDYGLVSEYKASDHMNTYVRDDGINYFRRIDAGPSAPFGRGGISLTGSSLSPRLGDFWNTHHFTDFMKYFDVIKQGKLPGQPRMTALRCSALLKLLPYEGFYPANRTLQLANLFAEEYRSGSLESNSSVTSAKLSFLSKPFFAPGILYNSIKAGIACDYPVFENRSTISESDRLADGNITNSLLKQKEYGESVKGSFINDSDDTKSHALATYNNYAATQGGSDPRLEVESADRIPFEALINPFVLGDKSIYDNEPHPSASLLYAYSPLVSADGQISFNKDNVATFTKYSLAMNNFVAETVNFFMEDGKLTSFKSETGPFYVKPLDTNRKHKMRFYVENKNTTVYERESAFGPSVENTLLYRENGGYVAKSGFKPYHPQFLRKNNATAVEFEFTPRESREYTLEEIVSQITASYITDYEVNTNIESYKTDRRQNSSILLKRSFYENLSRQELVIPYNESSMENSFSDNMSEVFRVKDAFFIRQDAETGQRHLQKIASDAFDSEFENLRTGGDTATSFADTSRDSRYRFLLPYENGLQSSLIYPQRNTEDETQSYGDNLLRSEGILFTKFRCLTFTDNFQSNSAELIGNRRLINKISASMTSNASEATAVASPVVKGITNKNANYFSFFCWVNPSDNTSSDNEIMNVFSFGNSSDSFVFRINESSIEISGSGNKNYVVTTNDQMSKESYHEVVRNHWNLIGFTMSISHTRAGNSTSKKVVFDLYINGKFLSETEAEISDDPFYGRSITSVTPGVNPPIKLENYTNNRGKPLQLKIGGAVDASDNNNFVGQMAEISMFDIPLKGRRAKKLYRKFSDYFLPETQLRKVFAQEGLGDNLFYYFHMPLGRNKGSIFRSRSYQIFRDAANVRGKNSFLLGNKFFRNTRSRNRIQARMYPRGFAFRSVLNSNYREAMYLNSSFNLFGVQEVQSTTIDTNGNTVQSDATNQTKRAWVIQPKWELPVLNFNNTPAIFNEINISGSVSVVTSSLEYAWKTNDLSKYYIQSSRGLWHQYSKVNSGYKARMADGKIRSWERSLIDLCKFDRTEKTIGNVRETKIISEAIVAIPFYRDPRGFRMKPFEARKNTLDAAIRRISQEKLGVDPDTLPLTADHPLVIQTRMLDKYVFPPQYDYLTFGYDGQSNPPQIAGGSRRASRVLMYVFEFEVELDKEDLMNIWQNLPPKIAKHGESPQDKVVMHDLSKIIGGERKVPDDIRWAVFKVKRRAEKSYLRKVDDSLYDTEAGNLFRKAVENNPNIITPTITEGKGPSYNWPYDFFSLIELIKIDSKVIIE